MAFIARHRNTKQVVSFGNTGDERWIGVDYIDQGWLAGCPPDVHIFFALGGDNRLVSATVNEEETCS
jgi:hypothetical protein